ncbi:DUF1203 domain-containing protein [Winogradskya humida]|uniref:DUF1203 domain-containing protein n=1 Tax=Winogradskya humida TaxID=113566 RepID=UPI0019449A57|nr:DUF1203 domain-containing protein [Actinoplanes humidus]
MRIDALPGVVLSKARNEGAGSPVEFSTAEGGEPLRCCLRDATPGEDIMLFGYAPELPPSPYREIGPVFAHAEPCDTTHDENAYPADWLGRPQVLRAYDRDGRIHPATRVHDGTDPTAAITDILTDPDVVQIHSRNVSYGCYMFAIRR